jgi:hypothetical protein
LSELLVQLVVLEVIMEVLVVLQRFHEVELYYFPAAAVELDKLIVIPQAREVHQPAQIEPTAVLEVLEVLDLVSEELGEVEPEATLATAVTVAVLVQVLQAQAAEAEVVAFVQVQPLAPVDQAVA